MEEFDLYFSAIKFIKQHGVDAELHAALKADVALEEGDLEDAKTWRDITKKINIVLTWATESAAGTRQ